MAEETVFAVIDADGVVVNKIVAEQEFIDSLAGLISDPDADTGDLTADHRFYDVTDKDPRPGVGWTRARNGRYTAPVAPEPTEEELAAREAAEADADARAADDAFITDALERVRGGAELTAAEQSRVELIRLARA